MTPDKYDYKLEKKCRGIDNRYIQISLSKNYGGQRLSVLNWLCAVAQKDFPDGFDLESVSACMLGGRHRKGMWGIEFIIAGDQEIPDDYYRCGDREDPDPVIAGGY